MVNEYNNNYFKNLEAYEKVRLNPEYRYPRPNGYTNNEWLSYIYYSEVGFSSIVKGRICNEIVYQFSNQIRDEKVLNRQLYDDIMQWIKKDATYKQFHMIK